MANHSAPRVANIIWRGRQALVRLPSSVGDFGDRLNVQIKLIPM